jgi:hypothetical protein
VNRRSNPARSAWARKWRWTQRGFSGRPQSLWKSLDVCGDHRHNSQRRNACYASALKVHDPTSPVLMPLTNDEMVLLQLDIRPLQCDQFAEPNPIA